jgi:protein TonB
VATQTPLTPQPLANSASSPTPIANVKVTAPTAPPDREPDYQATYLSNPKPPYPAIAARMGWQGKVIIRVEVLATGLAGQVSVQHSSGHEVLDNAALQAVRGWRFVPARQNGQLVNKTFLIPLPFTLTKDSDE